MARQDTLKIPPERLASLTTLLQEYGPYRRDQLRLKLLKAAQQCRDEADHLRRSAERFPQASQLAPRETPTPSALDGEAAILDAMAAFVATARPSITFTQARAA